MKRSELKQLIREVIEEAGMETHPVQNNTAFYEVELDEPEVSVTFEGPDDMSEAQILNKAIEKLTDTTYIYRVVKKPVTKKPPLGEEKK